MPRVNHDILRWARETAGLAATDAVEKIQLRAARGVSAVERLAALESGNAVPTRAMLVRMAQHYRRPLLTFYLSAPPRRGDRGQDFRTLPDAESLADQPLLDTLIRDIQVRQSIVRAVLEDEEEAAPLSFVGSKRMADGVRVIVSSIRETIQVSLHEFRAQSSPEAAFSLLRRGSEEAGVFVLLRGDLGSYHTAIDPEIFRGFALADEVAPFVVINDRDSSAAWSFTLIHELTHLWLGETGVSGASAEIATERFCNDVASEFLLPTDELKGISLDDARDVRLSALRISDFVRERNLSHSMVAYRLYRVGMIDEHMWRDLSTRFGEMWRQERRRRRERARSQEGGPTFYVVRRHRVGRALLELVGRMVSAGALTTSKAGMVLGVKPKQVQPLLQARRPE